jgi:hypothetical protein
MNINKAAQSEVNPLEQVVRMFAHFVDTKPHYLVGLALWALHTHIYNQYSKSPRLAILSPVPNCGKSTVLDVLGAMTWNAKRVIDPTVASTFRLANGHTLLLDEVDNMSIIRSMRSVLNDGHSAGGCVTRVVLGNVVSFPVYGPVALAGIGRLPATLMSRSLIIRLHRSTKALERFNNRQHYYEPEFSKWAKQAELESDPRMPTELVGRNADKWRPLIAIADSFDRGEVARKAALAFITETDGPDVKECVLRDAHKVFSKTNLEMLTTDALHSKLIEDKDGEHEIDYVEHKVSKRMIGNIFIEFQIRTKPHRQGSAGKVQRCWFRKDFEDMWKRYI